MLEEILPPHTGRAFAAMQALRAHLPDAESFVRQVDQEQRPIGYRLVGVFPDDGGDALAVAGFHCATSLSWGRHLYVADLSTLPAARQQGHAGRLLEWLSAEAQRLGCTQIHLDSGVGANRSDAHRLYLNAGYTITAHHFARQLG